MPALNIKAVLFLMVLCLGIVSPDYSDAFFGSKNNVIVEINDQEYTDDDFKKWWKAWQEPHLSFPETPDEFIDWMLLSQESDAMQFYENQTFKRKVSVFLKVQTLMLLRQEEVTERIVEPSEAQIKDVYQTEYVPFLNLRMVALQTPEEINAVQSLLGFGTPLKAVVEQAGYSDPARYIDETGEMRPLKIPAPIREIAMDLKPGEVGGPVVFNNSTYLFELVTRREGTDDDFKSLRDSLIRKFKKQEDDRLTNALIDSLKKKYQVEVDHEYLDTLVPENLEEADEGKLVISIGETEVTVGQLLHAIKSQLKILNPKIVDTEKFQTSRDSVITGIVTQTLLGLESVARHYEERPPFIFSYEFYRQNRLIKELENEIIRPQVQVTKEDIRKEYDQNPDTYSKEENLVEIYLIDTKSEKLANILGEQLKSGEDFASVMKVLAPNGLEKQQKMPQHLSFEIQDALASLVPGQSAGPISSEGKQHFIKYLGKIDRVLIPLQKIESKIRSVLEGEKFKAARDNYLQRLKENSKIKISNKVWEKTRRQLLETTDDQT